MLLEGMERGAPNRIHVFCDTGNEHQQTYDYVRYLADATKTDIRWIKADFSRQMAGKREFIAKRWAADLMTGKPKIDGYWFRNDLVGCDDESTVEPVPLPSYKPIMEFQRLDDGVWSWFPSRAEQKPFSMELAQEVCEAAIAMLQPTGNPFLDLCLWKGRFPSTKARFCTEELKIFPIQQQIFEPLLSSPGTRDVYSWQGVRADESMARAKLPVLDEVGNGLFNYRPILDWTAGDVFDMHKRHGIKPNPLYLQGMGRVGCMPCVNCRKDELSEIGKRFPDEVARIARWESLVSRASKYGSSTFFASVTDPMVGSGDMITHETHGIHRMIEWAGTTRGGRQFDLLGSLKGSGCSSSYGLCDSYEKIDAKLLEPVVISGAGGDQ